MPYTGEAIVLAYTTDAQLAQALERCATVEQSRCGRSNGNCRTSCYAESNVTAAQGAQAPGRSATATWKLTGDNPDRTEYDLDELRGASQIARARGADQRGRASTR